MLFGVNILLILVMQERDQVSGEIKWSILPLALNNTYMIASNLWRYYETKRQQDGGQTPSSPSSIPSSSEKHPKVETNKNKIFLGIVWYAGTMVGYALMERNGQGLAIKSSRDMLNYTASETLFMVSMGMCYFYGW